MSGFSQTHDLGLLQALRLKGRSDAARIADATGGEEAATAGLLASLVDAGLAEDKGGTFVLSESGEALRSKAIDAERSKLDPAAMEGLYADFKGVDADFKALVADVQLGKLEREAAAGQLTPIHERLRPLLEGAGELLPRLARYGQRFEEALRALQGGDPRYLASPLVESYHGVWFEFHEELIQASGRTRKQEAIGEG